MTVLVETVGLEVHYPLPAGSGVGQKAASVLKAVDGVSLSIRRGETFGIVGESGSGKTTLARAMLRFVEPTAGDVLFRGDNLWGMDRTAQLAFRRRAQMIFQNPVAALNPRMTVRDCIDEVLRVHGEGAAAARRSRITELLSMVGMSDALADRLPRSLSGGQCQRVGIARALAVQPELLVADEATAALDVSIQAQILNLIADLKVELNLTVIFISHNLGVVRRICDRIAVMHHGRVVETGPTAEVLESPREAYTRELVAAIPSMARPPGSAVVG
jgi:ABC-type glutathione transport system ATPase component